MASPRALFAAAILVAGTTLAGLQSPSAATPVTGPSPNVALPPGLTAEQVHNQDLVDAVVQQMWQSKDTSGYARATVNIEALTVEIMWKGEPPADVKRLAGTTKDGVRVSIVQVPYSDRDVGAAAARIARASSKGLTLARANAVTANDAFDGLIVEIGAGDLARSNRGTLAKQFASHARMPVTLRHGERAVPLSRWNDSNGSWHGGAGMTRGPLDNPFNACTTGWAVLVPSGPHAGEGRLISAGHCDLNQAHTALLDTAWNDGNGDRLTEGGPDVWVDEDQVDGTDSLVMDPVGGTQGKIYRGPWDATLNDLVSVGSAYQNAVGDQVCTGGANSGEHCGPTFITDVNVRVVGCIFTFWTCRFHRIQNYAGATIGVNFDSGGPVFAVRADGRVSARGIINAGHRGYESTCPPPATIRYYYLSHTCYLAIYMSPITTILTRWVKDIETSP